jgi:hypothetical protein
MARPGAVSAWALPLATGSPRSSNDRGDLCRPGLRRQAPSQEPGPARWSESPGSGPSESLSRQQIVLPPAHCACRRRVGAQHSCPAGDLAQSRRAHGECPCRRPAGHVASAGVFAGRVETGGARRPSPCRLDQKFAVLADGEPRPPSSCQWDPNGTGRTPLTWFRGLRRATYKRDRPRRIATKLSGCRPGPALLLEPGPSTFAAAAPRRLSVDLILDDAPVWRGFVRITE